MHSLLRKTYSLQIVRSAKRGARRLPVLLFSLCRPQSRRVLTNYDWPGFAADAHRMRGVISLCFALSPVESYRLFPWQVSSRLLMYAHVMPNARGIRTRKFALVFRDAEKTRLLFYGRILLHEQRFA
jgi:hypothetical protein